MGSAVIGGVRVEFEFGPDEDWGWRWHIQPEGRDDTTGHGPDELVEFVAMLEALKALAEQPQT